MPQPLSLIETLHLTLVLAPTLVMILSVTLTPTSNLVLGLTIALIIALAVAPTGYGRISTTLLDIHHSSCPSPTGGDNSKSSALELRRARGRSSVPSAPARRAARYGFISGRRSCRRPRAYDANTNAVRSGSLTDRELMKQSAQ